PSDRADFAQKRRLQRVARQSSLLAYLVLSASAMSSRTTTHRIDLRNDDPFLFHRRLETMSEVLAAKGGRIVRVEHHRGSRPVATVHYTFGDADGKPAAVALRDAGRRSPMPAFSWL